MSDEWTEYEKPQEVCPKCGSDNIANEDGPDDFNRLPVTCHNCGYQWVEPSGEEPDVASTDGKTVIAISEPDGNLVRTLIVPTKLANDNEEEIRSLADYGNQSVQFISPDECQSFDEIKAIFDEMNPPDEDEEESED